MTAALRLGDGPVLFSGSPPFLRGDVALVNTSTERLKVKSIPLAAHPATTGRATTAKAAPPAVITGEVRVAVKLPPGGAAKVGARLRVDPHLPAGRYTTALEVEGRRVDAVVQVFERDAVRLEPRPLYLRGAAGETLTQPMVVANLGNVGHTVPPGLQVHLGEKDWLGRSLVYALRDTEVEHDHNYYLDQLFREIRATLPAPARVKVTAPGDGALPPGATAELQLEVTLPEGLVKGRTYVGRTTFLGTGLGFSVDCVGSPKTAKRRPR